MNSGPVALFLCVQLAEKCGQKDASAPFFCPKFSAEPVLLCIGIFGPFSEAVHKYPELVKKYLGSVVPSSDNFFAALNSAVFSDGSFCYIPKGVRCPMELSTYFRINAENTGQFERTLIIANNGSSHISVTVDSVALVRYDWRALSVA